MATLPANEHPRVLLTDRILDRLILRFFPDSVTPNRITAFRFVSVPVVVYLLLVHSYAWGAALFAVSAFSDALDGARARTRNQVTEWGKVADPFADKLLVGAAAIIIVARYIGVWIAAVVVCVEVLIGGRALYLLSQGKSLEAKRDGKIKMILQSLSLMTLFAYLLTGTPALLTAATYMLGASVVFALLSLTVYASI